MRKWKTYPVPPEVKKRILRWSQRYNRVVVLDNTASDPTASPSSFSLLAGIGVMDEVVSEDSQSAFEVLEHFTSRCKDWLFGYLSYELKNAIEPALISRHSDGLKFPLFHFIQPLLVIRVSVQGLEIGYDEYNGGAEQADQAYEQLLAADTTLAVSEEYSCELNPRISKQEYLEAVNSLKNHIHRGDIYEANFCMEFFADSCVVDPVETYLKLSEISPMPSAAFGRWGEKFLLCASPERFIRRQGDHLISQPMKGTIRRGKDVGEDEQLKKALAQHPKERSENIMIVDLVRNDLSKLAVPGSVQVEELCGVYSFPQVHQMISTVGCDLKPNTSFADIIRSTFPMGSMTGAPKVSAMELIERYEAVQRGVYAGSLGYITPEGDADFNVVIRTMLYNQCNRYFSFKVGSAITAYSDPEREYEECLIKAQAMFKTLESYQKMKENMR